MDRPTDPVALIAHLDAESQRDQAQANARTGPATRSTDPADFVHLADANAELAEREGQRYRALAHSIVSAPPAVHPLLPADAARDREVLDNIATAMAESDDWDSDLTGIIADQVRSSGRPDPGFEVLTDTEETAVEASGGDLNEARAHAYRQKIDAARTAAVTARFDSTPLGVEGLDNEITAAWEQVSQARNRAQVLTARLMARQIMTAYLDPNPTRKTPRA